MKKRFALILCSLAMVCWSGMALAMVAPLPSTINVTLNYAFTADNFISSFGLYLGEDLVQDLMPTTLNISEDWQYAKTGSYQGPLNQGEQYTLRWGVYNENRVPPTSDPVDPMAFVGQFSINNGDLFQTSATGGVWSVSSGSLNSYGAFQNGGTWAAGYSSLSGAILAGAEWIGAGVYPGDSIETLVTATFTAPVPLPGAAILLGSGLLGLVGLRRREIV